MSGTRSAVSVSISRTGSWSISMIRPTKTCSRKLLVRSATAHASGEPRTICRDAAVALAAGRRLQCQTHPLALRRRRASINLNKPIPVYITYQTAFVDDARRLQIRPDIYKWDKDIASLLRGDSKVADIPIHRDYGSNSKPVLAHIPTRRRNEFSEKRYEWEPGWEQTYFQRRSSYYGQIDHYRFW